MNSRQDDERRRFLKAGCAALALIPVIGISGTAAAAKNEGLRTSLKYQDHPMGEKRCDNCAQFIPGKTPTAPGGCKIIPGDTEILPQGYCIAWVKKP